MPKKSEPKSGRAYNILGDIKAQKVVIGDQYNYYSQHISTPPQFAEEVLKLAVEAARLKQQAKLPPSDVLMIEAAATGLQEAAQEAASPAPLGERVVTTLEEAKKLMDALSGGLTSAAELGAKIGGLILLAGKVFGG
jgi:hypothetical protein